MIDKLRLDVNWFHDFLAYFLYVIHLRNFYKKTRSIVKALFFTLNKLF